MTDADRLAEIRRAVQHMRNLTDMQGAWLLQQLDAAQAERDRIRADRDAVMGEDHADRCAQSRRLKLENADLRAQLATAVALLRPALRGLGADELVEPSGLVIEEMQAVADFLAAPATARVARRDAALEALLVAIRKGAHLNLISGCTDCDEIKDALAALATTEKP